jgi:hypothetical protein
VTDVYNAVCLPLSVRVDRAGRGQVQRRQRQRTADGAREAGGEVEYRVQGPPHRPPQEQRSQGRQRVCRGVLDPRRVQGRRQAGSADGSHGRRGTGGTVQSQRPVSLLVS